MILAGAAKEGSKEKREGKYGDNEEEEEEEENRDD